MTRTLCAESIRRPPVTRQANAPGCMSDRRHLPALDGLRGAAIMMVIAEHAGVFPHGWVGVDLFFVLSGFLITGILVRAKERPHYYKNFFARRALRVFPAAFAYIALLCILVPVFKGRPLPDHQGWLWTYTTNIAVAWPAGAGFLAVPRYSGHLWSLAVEEHFYLVWPIVVRTCSIQRLRQVCVWGIVVAFVLRLAQHLLHIPGLASYVFTPMRMDTLFSGALLAISPEAWSGRLRRAVDLGGPAVALCAIAILVTHGAHAGLVETFGYSLIAFGATWVVRSAIMPGWFARMLESRPLVLAGRYSYAAYLGHFIVVWAVKKYLYLEGWPLALVAGASTFVCAAVSWQIFESPILSLKRYFPEPRPLVPLQSAPAASSPHVLDV